MPPDTWELGCCAASRRRAGPCARSLADPSSCPSVDVVGGDLLTGAGLEEALDGCSTAYYLVHSMEPAPNDDFAERDRRMAETFGEAAARAGVERIVYLGGIVPHHRPLSPHLGSRLEVEETLLAAVPGSTALRASIVIGAGSSSFRLLVRLVERLRVLPMPRWRKNRTAADRRARRDRVPRSYARRAGGRGALARRGRARRDDLRPDDRANRRRRWASGACRCRWAGHSRRPRAQSLQP